MRNDIPLLNILFRIEDGEDVGNSKNLFEHAYNVIRLQDVRDTSHCLKRVHRCGFNGIFLQLEGKSTHHLDEVATLCDRVVVIDKGVSAFSGDITQFKALSAESDLREAFLSVLQGSAGTQQQGVA